MIEYISQHVWQLWAVVAVICLIFELMAGDFFIICFSIGAVFAAIVCRVYTYQSVLGSSLCQAISAQGRGSSCEQRRCPHGASGQGGGNHQGRWLWSRAD